jgi:glycerophosphoryl diester phosphodiesterase
MTITVPARVRSFVRRSFVNCWTVNDPREARRVFDLGVDAVITDYPRRILASFEP